MFLAIHAARMPISIANPEEVRNRLLGLDNIGIIPSYDPSYVGNHHFWKVPCVYEVMHYDDLGRFKRRIFPYITWEPLPILRPEFPKTGG
jgi:hypothetical protein